MVVETDPIEVVDMLVVKLTSVTVLGVEDVLVDEANLLELVALSDSTTVIETVF